MKKNKLIIRDAIHGDIEIIDNLAAEIIDSYEFQRLRRITQLAGGQYVFPSAYHTRFSHSLGTYYIISQIMDTLDFKQKYDEHQRMLVRLAGLLHDIGHGPFSHTFEVLNEISGVNFTHEQYSTLIINSPETEINQILSAKLSADDLKIISQLIEGNHSDLVLNSLVSSQLDADRLDYLLRDSITSGVGYSTPDLSWIIRHISIKDDKIIYPQKVQYAIESYLIGRYHMYKQIYYHPVSIGFDLTFKMLFTRIYHLSQINYHFVNQEIVNIFQPFFVKQMFSISDYCQIDDYSLFTLIKKLKNENDPILQQLSTMFVSRKFLKLITEPKQLLLIKQELQLKYQDDYQYFYVYHYPRPFDTYNKNQKAIYLEIDQQVKRLDEISEILHLTSKDFDNKPCYFTLRMVK